MEKTTDTICCALQVGQEVPDFQMETYEPTNFDFGSISLAQHKEEEKWTILFFYPADFTFVCSTEMADLAEQYENFKQAGAEVVAVSTDTKFVHLAWRREEKFLENARFPMAADPTGRISRLFGVYDEGTGLALRGTFLIDPEGVLVGSEVNFYNVGRNAKELLRKLKAAAHVRKHPHEACPAKWEEGEKTLTPGAGMVGKVYEALK